MRINAAPNNFTLFTEKSSHKEMSKMIYLEPGAVGLSNGTYHDMGCIFRMSFVLHLLKYSPPQLNFDTERDLAP